METGPFEIDSDYETVIEASDLQTSSASAVRIRTE
jgi:hypothetical protein